MSTSLPSWENKQKLPLANFLHSLTAADTFTSGSSLLNRVARGARAAVDVSCTEKKQNGRIRTIEKPKEYLQNNNNNNNNKNTTYFSYSKFATSETERYRE